jgi:hypothetical protein
MLEFVTEPFAFQFMRNGLYAGLLTVAMARSSGPGW